MGSNKITDKNRLSINNAELSREWDYDKNALTPYDVACDSTQMVWWLCNECGYSWECKITYRNRYIKPNNNGQTRVTLHPSFCPKCNCNCSKVYGVLNCEWDAERNMVDIYLASRNKKYFWKCNACNESWETWLCNRLKGYGNCPYCNSLGSRYPHIAKEFSNKNDKSAYEVNYGSDSKYIWVCYHCSNEWEATVSSRTCGGNGCPKCSKVTLSNGMTFDSKTEAYVFLELSRKHNRIIYNQPYGKGMGRSRYDFYIPSENKYIEVTSFHGNTPFIDFDSYLKKVESKRSYVESIGAQFEFIQHKLTRSDERMLSKYIV